MDHSNLEDLSCIRSAYVVSRSDYHPGSLKTPRPQGSKWVCTIVIARMSLERMHPVLTNRKYLRIVLKWASSSPQAIRNVHDQYMD